MPYVIQPGRLGAFIKREVRKTYRAAVQGSRMAARKAVDELRPRTLERANDTGLLARKWKYGSLENGGRAFDDVRYGQPIDLGVAPGRIPLPRLSSRGSPVPFPRLLKWVERKFIAGPDMQKRIREFRMDRAGAKRAEHELFAWKQQRMAELGGAPIRGGAHPPDGRSLHWAAKRKAVAESNRGAEKLSSRRREAQIQRNAKESWAYGIAIAIQRKLNERGLAPREIVGEPAFLSHLGDLQMAEIARAIKAGMGGGGKVP